MSLDLEPPRQPGPLNNSQGVVQNENGSPLLKIVQNFKMVTTEHGTNEGPSPWVALGGDPGHVPMKSALWGVLRAFGGGERGTQGQLREASWLHVISFVPDQSHPPSSSAYFRLGLA